MGSDPGTDIPPDQGLHGETLDQNRTLNNTTWRKVQYMWTGCAQ